MAITPVGGAVASSTSSVSTLAVTYAPTAGNIVLAGIGTNKTGASTTGMSIKDSSNNALTAGPTSSPTTGIVGYLFYYTAASGITSFTASWTGAISSGGVTLFVEEYSGALGGVNPTGNQAADTTTSCSVTFTTTQNNSFFAGLLYFPGSSNLGSLTSGTQRQISPNTSGLRSRFADITASTAGSSVALTNSAPSTFWSATGLELLPNAPFTGVANGLMMMGYGK